MICDTQPLLNSTERAGYWGDYHKCDSPAKLIKNICAQVASNHEVIAIFNQMYNSYGSCIAFQKIDIIYYTGNSADHFDWIASRSTVMHAIEFVTEQIKIYFPNTTAIMMLGNLDIHPQDA